MRKEVPTIYRESYYFGTQFKLVAAMADKLITR
jgi:hypothetical protein